MSINPKIEPPYREIPLNEPIASNVLLSDANLGFAFDQNPAIDNQSIERLDMRYGLGPSQMIKEQAKYVGAVINPLNNTIIATGVLISENLFLTTGHYSLYAEKWLERIYIDFYFDSNIASRNPVGAELVGGGLKPVCDFAIFRLDKPLTTGFAIFDFQPNPDMYLIHHGAGPKRVTSIYASYTHVGGGILEYVGKHGPCVSGAPLFSIRGLAGIHSASDRGVCQAVPIFSILEYLKEKQPRLYKECYAAQIQRYAQRPIIPSSNPTTRFRLPAYETYQTGYRTPMLEFQYEGHRTNQELIKMSNEEALASLTSKEQARRKRLLRGKDEDAQEYLDKLKAFQDPKAAMTTNFEDRHHYDPSSANDSLRDRASTVAKTRTFGAMGQNKNKISSTVTMPSSAASEELKEGLDHLRREDVQFKNGIPSLKPNLKFTTQNKYPVLSTPLTFSSRGNSRTVEEATREQTQFEFGIKEEDGVPKISHFEKPIQNRL